MNKLREIHASIETYHRNICYVSFIESWLIVNYNNPSKLFLYTYRDRISERKIYKASRSITFSFTLLK